MHRQKTFSLVDSQDTVNVGNEILFGDGETKKRGHPGTQVLFVSKHPFMDYGPSPDIVISGLRHYPGEIILKIVPDMPRRRMPSHKSVEETARGRFSCYLYH